VTGSTGWTSTCSVSDSLPAATTDRSNFFLSFQYTYKNAIFSPVIYVTLCYIWFSHDITCCRSARKDDPARSGLFCLLYLNEYIRINRPRQKKKNHAFIASGTKADRDDAFLDRFRPNTKSQLRWPTVTRHSRSGSPRSLFGF
jgi:hypothetical protein